MNPFCSIIPEVPRIHIVDIGASPIEGLQVYDPILKQGGYRLTGFEPNPAMYQELIDHPHSDMTFLPYAIGDGREGMLNICVTPGMTSLLEPNYELLAHFHGFAEWAQIKERLPILTRRLDDVEELEKIDFLKLDVQGSELSIIENGYIKVSQALVIHVETIFVPFYKNQPMFGEIDIALQHAGFMFHRFEKMESRIFKPLINKNNLFAGLSQTLWSDAVYVRNFMTFGALPPTELLKIARILHDAYGSYDLASLALAHFDKQTGNGYQQVYLEMLTGAK